MGMYFLLSKALNHIFLGFGAGAYPSYHCARGGYWTLDWSQVHHGDKPDKQLSTLTLTLSS